MQDHQIISEHKLDNPVWHSLSETQREFAISFDGVKFFHPDYCPFGGFIPGSNIIEAIMEYADLAGNFFIIGERPEIPKELSLKNELVCLQMTVDRRIEADGSDRVVKLYHQDQSALFELVNLVQPGYFREKTGSMGAYFGIFEKNQLVAVSGERMKMNDFTEVSAVVTHPDHGGKGFAKQLVAYTVINIQRQDKMPSYMC